jgi:hypothetical protein
MGNTRESRADSGVSVNGNNAPQINPKPKPKVHNNAGPMPKEEVSTSLMNKDRTR